MMSIRTSIIRCRDKIQNKAQTYGIPAACILDAIHLEEVLLKDFGVARVKVDRDTVDPSLARPVVVVLQRANL